MSDAVKTPLRVLRTAATNTVRPWEPNSLHPEIQEAPAPSLAPSVTALAEAERILARAQSEASRILAEAREQACEIRQYASEEGCKEGKVRGEAEREAILKEIGSNLKGLIDQLPLAWERFCLEQTPVFAQLTASVVEKILQTQLTLNPELVENIVRGALAHISQDQQPVVRLHPEDLALLDVARFEKVMLQPDTSLRRGGCRIESSQGAVDATVDGALERLTGALRGEL